MIMLCTDIHSYLQKTKQKQKKNKIKNGMQKYLSFYFQKQGIKFCVANNAHNYWVKSGYVNKVEHIKQNP